MDISPLPSIPAKRYFSIGEVGVLCDVKPHVLRYWEQEFTQLRPMKRRGNRRYYQHHEVLMIRRIRNLLYEQGFTISGARNQLLEGSASHHSDNFHEDSRVESPQSPVDSETLIDLTNIQITASKVSTAFECDDSSLTLNSTVVNGDLDIDHIRNELLFIRNLLEEF